MQPTHKRTHTQRSVSGLLHSHSLGAKDTLVSLHIQTQELESLHIHLHTWSHTFTYKVSTGTWMFTHGGDTVADTVTSLLIKEHEQKYIPNTSWEVILTFTQVRADIHTHTHTSAQGTCALGDVRNGVHTLGCMLFHAQGVWVGILRHTCEGIFVLPHMR